MALDTDAERADALALFTGYAPAAVAAGRFVRRLDEKAGSRSRSTTTTCFDTEAGLKVGLGAGIGAEGSQSRDDRALAGSWVREPGAGWSRAQLWPLEAVERRRGGGRLHPAPAVE